MSNQNLQKIKEDLLRIFEGLEKKEEVQKLSIFGSYVYGKPDIKSDVDILIEFKPDSTAGLLELASFKRSFEKGIGKKVDLLTPNALSKYFRTEVLNNSQVIYEKF